MNKNTSKKGNWVFILIFIIGLMFTIYPLISQWYYRIDSSKDIEEFDTAQKELDDSEIQERIKLAKAYNSTLSPTSVKDPFTKKEKEEGIKEYAKMLQLGELIGHIEIPKIAEDLPIYAGTSDEILQKGAGHLEGTSLPVGGEGTHTVITAHRGLPNATLFRNLDQLTYGDVFYIHNVAGTLAYEVDKLEVIEPTDIDKILVKDDSDIATLLTCTPYMINSHRLLVTGHRISYTDPVDETNLPWKGLYPDWLQLCLVLIPIILLLIYAIIRQIRKSKTLRERESYLEEI
ncbi:MAG: class C sortase [Tissierellia bacterium]|nr:class C sortase [Tissierellia bacterium]